MIRAAALVALVALAGCEDCTGAPEPVALGAWPSYPVRLAVSSDLPPCAIGEARSAAAWLNGYAVTVSPLEFHVKPPRSIEVLDPPQGWVSVTRGRGPTPDADHGGWVWVNDGRIHSAEIRLSSCEPRTIRHEVAHALGLADLRSPGAAKNLMFIKSSRGDALSEDQLRWVRTRGRAP